MKNIVVIALTVTFAVIIGVRPVPAADSHEAQEAVKAPVYKPPMRGAPGGRVGGGTRGIGDLATITVLAPDHVGLTANPQPSLFWSLSKPISMRMEFALNEPQNPKPIFEITIKTPLDAGIHSINLTDYGITLKPGKQYEWFVAIVPDPAQRSSDIMAGGFLEYITASKPLQDKIAKAGKNELSAIYAEEGIWYNAVSSLSDLITANPNDKSLIEQRVALLKQVGLKDIDSQ
jgi:hypothetical protein